MDARPPTRPRTGRSARMRQRLGLLTAVVLSLGLAPFATQAAYAETDPGWAAFDGEDFDAGLIISDDSFYNDTAMSEREIQDFLRSQPCTPEDLSPCLSVYRQNTTTQPDQGTRHCAVYRGARGERASRIVAKVAEACGISPRVLLVLLQKEQSLLTRPSAYGYQRATGYGCPDTADCDAKYFGFFNQVYNAAWQFRQYTEQPERDYRIGTVDVQYNPDPSCGASTVRIRNQATANLYNYTPYQPNEAALSDLTGDGDACSTHGNLNFWLLYSKWFGDPLAVRFPAVFGPCANLVGGHGCEPDLWPLA
ncbi:hypothetical protein [Luethyella okanaganae]|uniref:Hemagglutinin n=1 Tax=Luethyella okanaganae TaxID=69372 RepID=A0ABW1VJZ4_9MICO